MAGLANLGAKMKIIILYEPELGETEQSADDMEWFIELSIKDYDGSEPEITYPEIEKADIDYFEKEKEQCR